LTGVTPIRWLKRQPVTVCRLAFNLLIVSGLTVDTAELQKLAGFIANDLGTDTPWHISRFHPTYKLTHQAPTPVKILSRAREIILN